MGYTIDLKHKEQIVNAGQMPQSRPIQFGVSPQQPMAVLPAKKSWFGKRQILVIVLSVALTTVGIKAADNMLNKSSDPVSDGTCPAGMVNVVYPGGNFCIDAYEVSPGKECAHANPQLQSETRANLNIHECRPVSVKGARPWRYISQNQAATACAKAGKRLPTNKEWLQAAQGTPDLESDWGPDDCQVAKNWGDTPGLTGSGSKCFSAAGAYDMIGNVWEWVEGTVYEGKYENRPLPSQGYVSGVDDVAMPSVTSSSPDENYNQDYLWVKNIGIRGIARGGYWDNKTEAGQYSVYVVSEPSFAGEGIGFRCVK